MFNVISKYASTAIVFADSHGPYTIDGGTPVTLTAGAANPNATYAWDLGDGNTATGATVVHTYGSDGVYIARLAVTVTQTGGVISRHYATINVRNVPPVVNAGPNKTVNEGEVVAFTGSFTDVQWLETHQATWDWGDSSKSDPGVVTETHVAPTGQGRVTGSLAWGDDGTYTVTLSVQDKGGAVGRARAVVTVLNMPPVVAPVAPMFAYPCCVLTLHARFTDPGWLDTHAAFWDFGDCTGPQRAVVREKNLPPAGEGVAIASHTYRCCGTFLATCTVIADDGAVGRAETVVRVVDIRNPGFADGFCTHKNGSVGNHWTPYLAAIPTGAGGAELAPLAVGTAARNDIFQAEEDRVHCGERAQHIQFLGRVRAGVSQVVGANPGWDYQVTTWYSLNEQAGGVSQVLQDVDTAADVVPPDATGGFARLGIDPAGGVDPSAPGIVWTEGFLRPEWAQLAVRATATGHAITIFLEAAGLGRLGADAFFDDAALQAVQPFCPPKPVGNGETCVDVSDVAPGAVPADYLKDGFHFIARDKQPQQIVAAGPPLNQHELVVRPRGLQIILPFTADAVSVTVAEQRQIPVSVSAFDAQGKRVGQTSTSPGNVVQTLDIAVAGIVALVVAADGDTAVIKVCAHPQAIAGR